MLSWKLSGWYSAASPRVMWTTWPGLDADPDVMRFVSGGIPTSREEIENDFLPAFLGYYQRYQAFGFWAAIEKSTGDFLGWFHFRQRVGSARAGRARLPASRRVMEKAGLTLVRTFSRPLPGATGGHPVEVVEYALSKAGWKQQDQGRASGAPQR
jgi:hypothetical protein